MPAPEVSSPFADLRPRLPGLFVTGTATGVGKTVVSCAIAAALRVAGHRVGAWKPLASGCRHDREGLVSEDAEALAHFSDASVPLAVVNPIRYAAALAPAVAAEALREPVPWEALPPALAKLEANADRLLVEGAGGVYAPLDGKLTTLDLVAALDLPAVVVTRPDPGTLNHTTLTVHAFRSRGGRVAGRVVHGYPPDAALEPDASIATNPRWIERLTNRPVLTVAPRLPEPEARVERGVLGEAVLEAIARVDWASLAKPPRRERERRAAAQ
jgi:dethiobiotin synthetase